MNTVTEELIIEVWERQCELNEQESRVLIRQFMEEQPAVGAYLAAGNEELGDEAGQSQLIPLAATLWEAMTLTGKRQLKEVPSTVVDHAEAANIQILEELDEGSEMGWHESALQLMTGYNQHPMLAFFLEILMADDEETPELAPERIGMEFLWLKTITDCFDQQTERRTGR